MKSETRMNPELRDELESLLLDWQDNALSDDGVQRVREILRSSAAARQHFVQLQLLEVSLREFEPVPAFDSSPAEIPSSVANVSPAQPSQGVMTSKRSKNSQYLLTLLGSGSLAAALVIGLWAIQHTTSRKSASPLTTSLIAAHTETRQGEATSQGIAIVTRAVDVNWSTDGNIHAGDALRPGMVAIETGLVQIEFFCGATVVLQGPAEFELLSVDTARIHSGRLRAQVPPAARGFKVLVNEMEVVDLGTDFGLSVSPNKADVHVFDGEVELRRPDHEQQRLVAGAAVSRGSDGSLAKAELLPNQFLDTAALEERNQQQTLSRFERWQTHSKGLRGDPRLVAYYAFDVEPEWNRRLKNGTFPTNPELDGAIVGARQTSGRWMSKQALEFKKPGDRVRVNIPGEFESLTFSCWVRIDSLDRWYNSLFLTDGYEQGEPHWQILNTGQLFFSVRVSRTPGGQEHREVLSPRFWNPSLSGQWLHLATTYDVQQKRTSHYLNGEQISSETIPDSQLVQTTRFGAASIGNWARPTKPDDAFAVRNLNGSMDEFAIFKAALTPQEIQDLYKKGRP